MVEIQRMNSQNDPIIRVAVLRIRPIYKLANSRLVQPVDWYESVGECSFDLLDHDSRTIFIWFLKRSDAVLEHVNHRTFRGIDISNQRTPVSLADPGWLCHLEKLVVRSLDAWITTASKVRS